MKGNLIKKSISMMLAFAMSSSFVCVSKAAQTTEVPTTPYEANDIIPISNIAYLDIDASTIDYGTKSLSVGKNKGLFIELDLNDLTSRTEDLDSVKLNVHVSSAVSNPVYVHNVTMDYPEIPKERKTVKGIDESWLNIKNIYDAKANDIDEDGDIDDDLESYITSGDVIKTDFASSNTGMKELDITEFAKKNIKNNRNKFLIYLSTHTTATPGLDLVCNPDAGVDANQTYLKITYKDISQAVLTELQGAENVEAYAAILEKYADIIGIDYDLIHSPDCLLGMVGQNYSSYEEVKDTFISAVADDLKVEQVKFDKIMNMNIDSTVKDCIATSEGIWIQAGRNRAAYLQKDVSSYKGNINFISKVYASFFLSNVGSDNIVIRGLDYNADVDTYDEYFAEYFPKFNNTVVAMTTDASIIGINKKVTVDITDYAKKKIQAGEWINLGVRNYAQNVGNAIWSGGNKDYAPVLTVVYDGTAMEEYNNSVVLTALNSAENATDLEKVVNENYSIIGVDKAALVNMDVVYNVLGGKDFASLPEFKAQFESEVNKYVLEKEIDLFNYGLFQLDHSQFSMKLYNLMSVLTTDSRYAILNYKPTDIANKNIQKATLKIAPFSANDTIDVNAVTIKYSAQAYSEALDTLQTGTDGRGTAVEFQGFNAATPSNATITDIGNEMKGIYDNSQSYTASNPGGKVMKWASDAVFEYVDLDATDALKAAQTAASGNLTMFVEVSPAATLMFDATYKSGLNDDKEFYTNGVPVKLMVYYDISAEASAALAAMNAAADVDEVAAALTANSLVYGTDLTGIFSVLTDEQKAVVYNALLAGKAYKEISQIKSVFDSALASIKLMEFTVMNIEGVNELTWEDTNQTGTRGQFYLGGISVRKNKEYSGDIAVMVASYRNGVLENIKIVPSSNVAVLKAAATGETVKLGVSYSLAPKLPSEIKIFVWDATSGQKPIAEAKAFDPNTFKSYAEGVEVK